MVAAGASLGQAGIAVELGKMWAIELVGLRYSLAIPSKCPPLGDWSRYSLLSECSVVRIDGYFGCWPRWGWSDAGSRPSGPPFKWAAEMIQAATQANVKTFGQGCR
jgi:hypothetical protein